MILKIGFQLFCVYVLSIFLTAVSYSAPKNTDDFLIQNGGFVDLPLGAVVEGSSGHGGIQPDYRIEETDPELIAFLKEVKARVSDSVVLKLMEKMDDSLKIENEKIKIVSSLVRKALPNRSYDHEEYLNLLKEHKIKGIDVSLGAYLKCRAGVCRENALLVHHALKAVGVYNQFVYVKVNVGKLEDHAIVVVDRGGVKWIVDPYNATFHGRPFEFMTKRKALSELPPKIAGFARRNDFVAQIVKINTYPTYWIPKISISKCSSLFTH